MSATVLLYTDRPGFGANCSSALQQAGLETKVSEPEALGDSLGEGQGAILDAASEAFDEDELLACVGLARALSVPAAVVLPEGDAFSPVEDVLQELCGGLVVRGEANLPALAASLSRRADRQRGGRAIECVNDAADGFG